MILEHIGLSQINGSLVVLDGVKGVQYDEMAELHLDDGSTRVGRVVRVDGDRCVIQVFEGTRGLSLVNNRTVLTGHPMMMDLSPELLGRVLDGLGRPNPYMIFANMRKFQVPSVQAVVKVGDTVSDIREGRNAGVRSLGVLEGSSVMGMTQAAYEALSAEKKQAALDRARQVFLEAGADEIPDEIMYAGIVKAHEEIRKQIDLIDQIVAEIGKPKMEYEHAQFNQELFDKITTEFMDEAKAAMDTDDKNVREERWNKLIEHWHELFLEDYPEMDKYLEEITYKFQKKIVKAWLLEGLFAEETSAAQIQAQRRLFFFILIAPISNRALCRRWGTPPSGTRSPGPEWSARRGCCGRPPAVLHHGRRRRYQIVHAITARQCCSPACRPLRQLCAKEKPPPKNHINSPAKDEASERDICHIRPFPFSLCRAGHGQKRQDGRHLFGIHGHGKSGPGSAALYVVPHFFIGHDKIIILVLRSFSRKAAD